MVADMGMYHYLWDRIWRDEDKELPATSLIWFSRCLVSTDGWHIKGPMMGETVHSTHGRGMLWMKSLVGCVWLRFGLS